MRPRSLVITHFLFVGFRAGRGVVGEDTGPREEKGTRNSRMTLLDIGNLSFYMPHIRAFHTHSSIDHMYHACCAPSVGQLIRYRISFEVSYVEHLFWLPLL